MEPILRKSDDSTEAVKGLLFGALLGGFALVWILVALTPTRSWVSAAFGVPFLLMGIGMVCDSIWRVLIKPTIIGTAFEFASARVSSSRLRSGESLVLQFEQAARRDLEVRRVQIQLVLRERATYQRGSSTSTVVQDNVIDQYEASDRRLMSGDILRETCTLRVPIDAMHTFEAKHNQLVWLAKIRVDVSRLPDITHEVDLMILPPQSPGTR